MKTLLNISLKYILVAKHKQSIQILSLITMIALGCGSCALIIVLSTFNGFEKLAISLYESFQPNLIVQSSSKQNFLYTDSMKINLSNNSGIEAFSEILEQKVYLKYNEKEALGILKGVDSNYFKTNKIAKHLLVGDTILEDEYYSFGIIGAGIADKLGVSIPSPMSSVEVYAPKTENESVGIGQLNYEVSYLHPSGIFSIYQEYDEKYIIAPITMVRDLYHLDSMMVNAIEIKTSIFAEKDVKQRLLTSFGRNFTVKNRLEANENLYKITRNRKNDFY